jgi:hypothetical protein
VNRKRGLSPVLSCALLLHTNKTKNTILFGICVLSPRELKKPFLNNEFECRHVMGISRFVVKEIWAVFYFTIYIHQLDVNSDCEKMHGDYRIKCLIYFDNNTPKTDTAQTNIISNNAM